MKLEPFKGQLFKKLLSVMLLGVVATASHSATAKGCRLKEGSNPPRLQTFPLFPGGVLQCLKINKDTESDYEAGRYKGALYKVYLSDGSGVIQGTPKGNLKEPGDPADWRVSCFEDKMTDKTSCQFSKNNLIIIFGSTGNFVSVGHDNFPGSLSAVRVDKNEPISAKEPGGFTKEQSKTILEQLRTGQKVITRYQEWPYDVDKDEDFDLFGFVQAYEIVDKVHAELNLSLSVSREK